MKPNLSCLVSSVFAVFVFAAPVVAPAAAHLHRGMGQLALVGGLQCGQRGDAAEDHSVQRTHCFSHHKGVAAQRRPEAGTVFL